MCTVLASSTARAAAPPADDTNTGCIEKLQIPMYPPLARQARLSLLVTASVRLNAQAKVASVGGEFASERESGKAIFWRVMEAAMRGAQFAPTCTGKTVTVIMQFLVDSRSPSADSDPLIVFTYPNRFSISVRPPVMNVD
jgi:hypothetical protein